MHELDGLLELQERDLDVDRLVHRLETLDERSAVTEAAAVCDLANSTLLARESELAELRRKQKALEDEIDIVSSKIEDATRTLYGGTVKASRELLSIQAEIEMLESKRSDLEDSAIELILACDEADEARGRAQAELDAAKADEASATNRLQVAVAEIEAQISSAKDKRDSAREVAQALAALKLYDDLRKREGGVVISRLTDGVCGACRLKVSAVFETELRNTSEVPRCEHCSMILLP